MRKIILTFVGIALLAGPASEIAFSKERHHARNAQQFNTDRFRNTNAYAPRWYLPDAGSSSGLSGACGSMTGFN